MSWTDYRCVKCMNESLLPNSNRMCYILKEVTGKPYTTRIQCDGHCRKLLPPRRVSTPHNLDPKAYGIEGEDQKSMIDEYIDLFEN